MPVSCRACAQTPLCTSLQAQPPMKTRARCWGVAAQVKELGRGQFGSVWLARWLGVDVAVKELHSMSDAKSNAEMRKVGATEVPLPPCWLPTTTNVRESQPCAKRGGRLRPACVAAGPRCLHMEQDDHRDWAKTGHAQQRCSSPGPGLPSNCSAYGVHGSNTAAIAWLKRGGCPQEAGTLMDLSHPCVIAFYGIIVGQESPGTVIEYVRGSSLKSGLQSLGKQGKVTARFKVAIALQAARGETSLRLRLGRSCCSQAQPHVCLLRGWCQTPPSWVAERQRGSLPAEPGLGVV